MTRLLIDEPAQCRDLALFTDRVLRCQAEAVVRLRTRSDGLVAAWAAPDADVLACRAVRARLSPSDVTCGATALHRGLAAVESGSVDIGVPMDAAWRRAVPPETGFVHIDDVPAGVLLALADSQAVEVSDGTTTVTVPKDYVTMLTVMGFLPDPVPPAEVVRVRVTPAWLRIDARFGSVFGRREGPELLLRTSSS